VVVTLSSLAQTNGIIKMNNKIVFKSVYAGKWKASVISLNMEFATFGTV